MRVFISYSHKDRGFVRFLSLALERYSIEIWLDDHQLLIGERLEERLSSAISSVDFIILVISPSSLTSSWVYHELQLALHRETTEKQVCLLPLLLHGAQLPSELTDRVFADFRKTDEVAKAFPRLLRTLGIPNTKIKTNTKPETKVSSEDETRITEVCVYLQGFFLNNPATVMSSFSYDLGSEPYNLTGVDPTPYVNAGQTVSHETLLGRIGGFSGIEDEVRAECEGIVEEILVENMTYVHYGEALFKIKQFYPFY